MKVFVAGATGAVGCRLVPLLVGAGHVVFGMSRSPDKVTAIERAGATAVIADGLDAAAVRAAVLGAKPDVVVHQLTALRGMTDLRKFDRAFAQSNRLRTQGLDYLLAAARQAGVRRIVVQSYCGWPYARTGQRLKSEDDALDPDPPEEMRRSLDAIRYLERATTTSGLEGVVLRYGAFYGPDTGMLSAAALNQVRRRRFPLIGDGNGWWSFLHIDDAAAATTIAVERGACGIYNVVDDEPAPARKWLPELARIIGARPPLHVPAWLARILAGEHLVEMMTQARASSNVKAKRELGWRPLHPSWREGFATEVARSNDGLAARAREFSA
jgi:nucleoside-diphosphate-sugar epimerase